MKATVIGDVGWKNFFHLGDEAMTEVAINELRSRGFNEVTVVAGDPSVTKEIYSVHAVKRIGFNASWSRAESLEKMQATIQSFDELASHKNNLVSEISQSDLVVIAGGGNLNSLYPHHVYERYVFAKAAAHFNVPLVVSSQTVGPDLNPETTQLIREILDISKAFGVRESYSLELVQKLAADQDKVFMTHDDVILLPQVTDKHERVPDLLLPYLNSVKKFCVVSFTEDAGLTGLSKEAYYGAIARLLQNIIAEFDVDVILVPHTGSFNENVVSNDRKAQEIISGLVSSPRIISAPMLHTKTYLELFRKSYFSFSTRYHPLIFAFLTQKPSVGIALSNYSAVRMAGALEQYGLKNMLLTLNSKIFLPSMIRTFIEGQQKHEAAQKQVLEQATELQNQWWDFLAETPNASGSKFSNTVAVRTNFFDRLADTVEIDFLDAQFYQLESFLNETEELKKKIVALESDFIEYKTLAEAELNKSKHKYEEEIKRLETKNSETLAELQKANNRKIVRLVDRTADLFRRNR